jgi:hypothetical protein
MKLLSSGISIILSAVLFSFCSPHEKEPITEVISKDTLAFLENDTIKVTLSLFGGAIVSVHEKTSCINPLSWKLTDSQMPENNRKGAVFQGHYLSLGRWGCPTPGETKQGMPHNGEPSNNWWKLTSKKSDKYLMMSCDAPLDGMSINRKVVLSSIDPLFKVYETFNNELNIGRITTIVQCATIGAPFLDSTIIINTNATFGFNQKLMSSDILKYEYKWPIAFVDSAKNSINLSHNNYKSDYSSSHIFEDTIGWTTSVNPKMNLLLGYTWKVSDYPWLHIYNGLKNGKLFIKGIEFATTGLGDTLSYEKRILSTFHGVKNFDFVDAKANITKTYFCYLVHFNGKYKSTINVSFDSNTVTLKILTSKGIQEFNLTM